jgi:aspartate carbamoyltransferase catalytic subunit
MISVGSNILSIDQLEMGDIKRILQVSQQMEPYARRQKITRVLEGAVLGNLFFEPSTRSRVSFGVAFNRLGGSVNDTTGFQFSSMAKGESLFDTARVMSGYADILVMRHPQEGSVKEFAEGSIVPVINGGDGPGEHPTQALLDLYTIQKELNLEFNDIKNIRVALVGDLKYGRTVHSLLKLLSLFDSMEFSLISPQILQLPDQLIELLKDRGHKVSITNELRSGIADVDIVYITRLQQERFSSEEDISQYQGNYSLNHQLYEQYCKPGTVLLHPLPRDCRVGARELDIDLNKLPSLAIYRQTDNGIPVRMAIYAILMGVVDSVHTNARDVYWSRPSDAMTSIE